MLTTIFLNNSLRAWITAIGTAVVLFFLLAVLRRLLYTRLKRVADRTSIQFDDMLVQLIGETRAWVLVVVSLVAGANLLTLPHGSTLVDRAGHLAILWQVAVWGSTAVGFWTKHWLERRSETSDRVSVAMIRTMSVGAKIVVWFLVGVTALYTVFKIDPTPFVTAGGVGGIAVALAAQNILGDLLSALAIVFDKPFDVGDFISIGDVSGTVESIGLKTTRIRSLSGEQVVVGNSDLLKARLHNFKRMPTRRIAFNVDVTYETPPGVMERIPGMIQEIVTAQDQVRFERSHVASFQESAVRIETVYHVLDPDYTLYMNIQQAINLGLLQKFSVEKIEFAYPTNVTFHK